MQYDIMWYYEFFFNFVLYVVQYFLFAARERQSQRGM